jgi:NAD(P) transhydrogenase subunit alpha
VIVDLAAEQGGNCALTEAGKEVIHNGVKILGVVNVPSTMPVNASQMYAKNVSTLLQHLTQEGALHLDFDDEITDKTCVTHAGIIRNERVRQSLEQE